MKVKIKDTWYDANDVPIMLLLTPQDKKNINNMFPDKFKYAQFPDSLKSEEVDTFMEI